jgi:hypothetical protein
MGITRKSFKARFAGVLLAVVAGSLALAGPASAIPAGSGGSGAAPTQQPLAPGPGSGAIVAGEVYLAFVAAAVVVATAVLVLAVLGYRRGQRAAAR